MPWVGFQRYLLMAVSSCGGAVLPFGCFCGAAEERGEVGHVALVFVEETVEAYRGVVVGRTAEGAEAEAGVEAGFTHGPVAAVEGGGETVTVDVGVGADFGGGDVAADLCEGGGLGWGGIVGGVDEVAGVDVGMGEEPADDVGVVAAVVGHLGDGAFADVVIAREAGVSGAVDWRCPQLRSRAGRSCRLWRAMPWRRACRLDAHRLRGSSR